MKYDFWESPNGHCPAEEELSKIKRGDQETCEILLDKLKRYIPYSYNQLRKAGIIDKIQARNPYKIHEFRIDLPRVTCRLYCLPRDEKLIIYHIVIKKSPKLKPKDLEIAAERARIHLQK